MPGLGTKSAILLCGAVTAFTSANRWDARMDAVEAVHGQQDVGVAEKVVDTFAEVPHYVGAAWNNDLAQGTDYQNLVEAAIFPYGFVTAAAGSLALGALVSIVKRK